MTYSDKLKDRRWQKRRLELFEKAGFKCTAFECSSGDTSSLEVHHRVYIRGRDPWDYEDKHFQVLCRSCHSFYQRIMEMAHLALAEDVELEFFCAEFSKLPDISRRSFLRAAYSLISTDDDKAKELISMGMEMFGCLYHRGREFNKPSAGEVDP